MTDARVDGHATVMLWSFAIVTILLPQCAGVSVENEDNFGASSFINNHADLLVLISITTFAVLSIVILFLCGGCTDVEVSSETHPACGASRSKGDYSSIGTGGRTVITDYNSQQAALSYSMTPQTFNTANTFIGYGMGGRTFITDHNSQQAALPYSMTPQTFNTANAFIGYESSAQEAHAYLPGHNVRPTAPSVEDYQATRHNPGAQHPVVQSETLPGHNLRPTATSVAGYQATRLGPGAHHPVGQSETSPPSYNEAVGASRSNQNYGF